MIFNKVVAKLNAKRLVVKAVRCLEYDLLEYDLFFWNLVYINCTFHVLYSNKQTNCFIIANMTCVLNLNGRHFCSLNGLSEKFSFDNFNGIVKTILTLSSVCFIVFLYHRIKKIRQMRLGFLDFLGLRPMQRLKRERNDIYFRLTSNRLFH